jgi:hypothetical protein
MRRARTLLIATALAAFVTTLAFKTMLVSPPRAETVSNTVSVHELHRTMKDLPVQETKDPV